MTRTEKDKIKAWVARNGRVRKYHEEVLNKGNIEIVEKSEELTDEEILALIKYNKKQSRKYVQPKKGGRFFMADFETTTQEAMERTGADHTEVWAWAICPIPVTTSKGMSLSATALIALWNGARRTFMRTTLYSSTT